MSSIPAFQHKRLLASELEHTVLIAESRSLRAIEPSGNRVRAGLRAARGRRLINSQGGHAAFRHVRSFPRTRRTSSHPNKLAVASNERQRTGNGRTGRTLCRDTQLFRT
jgi:hypothetical protein